MIRCSVNDVTLQVQEGTTVLQALTQSGNGQAALLALCDGRETELTDTVAEGMKICPLTMHHEAGRRVYERTLRLVLLMAARCILPGKRVRIEYSSGHGVFVRFPDVTLDQTIVDRLSIEMRRIIDADLPIHKSILPLGQVRAWYAADGQQDKLELLESRKLNTMTMYNLTYMDQEYRDYFYGVMAPSTGYVPVFRLVMQYDGLVVLPMLADGSEAPQTHRPKHEAVFGQSAQWCRILGVENVADLTKMAKEKRLRGFIRVNEALHDQAIGAIARDIVANDRHIVMVAGPSSSGKTTFAGRLGVHLQVLGRKATRISLDDYYLNRQDIPLQEDGTIDLEAITTLDLPLLQQQMNALLAGQTVNLPRYDFHSGMRAVQGVPFRLSQGEIIIVEGIHGLNPDLCSGIPADQIHRVFVSALTCLNLDDHNRIRTTDVRLLRRITRDFRFRGTSPKKTLGMWDSVRRGEEKWIFPYQELADSVFNTALHYELPVLAHYAAPLLQDIDPTAKGCYMASRLRKMLNYMPELDEQLFTEIPPLSLLREFIGGGTMQEV